MTAPTADIVVRFRDPTKEQQGYYDLGFVKDRTGVKSMVGGDGGYRQR